MAELADALDSKSSGFTLVPVRVRPSAPANIAVHRKMNRFFVFTIHLVVLLIFVEKKARLLNEEISFEVDDS